MCPNSRDVDEGEARERDRIRRDAREREKDEGHLGEEVRTSQLCGGKRASAAVGFSRVVRRSRRDARKNSHSVLEPHA